jgi:branched-chain amino acid transport system permease protein
VGGGRVERGGGPGCALPPPSPRSALDSRSGVDTFIQLTLNGLTLGSVYALIALGYSLVYGILKLLNFAHGDVFMVGTFIGFGVLNLLGGASDPVVPSWLLLTLIPLSAMAGCAVLGVAIERFAYRPLRDAPRIAPLISALGVSFFLAYSMQLLFGADLKNYDMFALDDGALYFKGFDIGNVRVPLIRIITIVAAFAMMIVLWLLVTKTRIGKAMRATSHDREAAAMMGIDIDRVIVFAFVLGSALAGAAGVLFALRVPTQTSIGFVIGLKGFTAAVIGGIGSIPGALAGGLVLGFAESYTQGYISTRWSDLLVFIILILFLLFRPQGILGKADIRKV